MTRRVAVAFDELALVIATSLLSPVQHAAGSPDATVPHDEIAVRVRDSHPRGAPAPPRMDIVGSHASESRTAWMSDIVRGSPSMYDWHWFIT